VRRLATAAAVLAAIAAAPAYAEDPAAPDPAYGAAGVASTPVNRDFAVLPDGGLVATGGAFEVARLDARGQVAGTGRVPVGEGARAEAVAVQPDGRIVVAGARPTTPRPVLVIARLTPALEPDASFGRGGVVEVGEVTGRDADEKVAADVVVTPGGRILVLTGRFGIVALTPEGKPDAAFGSGGNAHPLDQLQRPDPGASGTEMLPLADGRLLVLGQSEFSYDIQYTSSQPLLAKLGADGSADRAFGDGGLAKPGFVLATGVTVQPSGRIVVSGYQCGFFKDPFDTPCPYRLDGFTAAGRLDTGFGKGGKLTIPRTDGGARSLASLPDGRLLVGANGKSVRLTPSGAVDLGYGGYGVAAHPLVAERGFPLAGDSALLAGPALATGGERTQEGRAVRLLGGPGRASRTAAPPFAPVLEAEDSPAGTLDRKTLFLPVYLPRDVRVSASLSLVGLGDFDYIPLSARMLRRLRLKRTLAKGSGLVRACREGEGIRLRFDPAMRRRLRASRRGTWRLRLSVEVRNAGGVARAQQDTLRLRRGGVISTL
jgi:uncharacterized delta-60 repeat protein